MKKKNLRFEKFSKLTDIQKMAITFMIGIFLTIGCITLYKTFAIYKEEKTFYVIEGRVPDFTKKDKDLEIAIMVDGVSTGEVPTESHDYRVRVECDTEEISGTWNYNNWYADITGHITQAATCTIIFESIYDSIIVDGEEKTQIPDKGDYQYNLTCTNITNSTFDEESWKPIVTGVNTNSSCSIVFKSTNSIITKIIDANGNEVESYPSKEEASGGAKIACTPTSVTGEWDKENWKIKKISNITNDTTCEIVFSKIPPLDVSKVTVGDYIAYTPGKTSSNSNGRTSYEITTDLTGYSSKQTINPSELNLWRVIKINEDDTIEIVSEYVSSKYVYFYGKEGYRKLVGSLNTIVSDAYETEGITIGSHHMGFDGEQEKCSYYTTCNDKKTNYNIESEDTRLVTASIGNKKATKPDGSSTFYLLASRYTNGTDSQMRVINSSGEFACGHNLVWGTSDHEGYGALRPIVTIKSGISATEGSKNGKKLWTIEQ